MPAAPHLLPFLRCSERRGQCIAMQKREAGSPEVNAMYQCKMSAIEKFLALSFFHPGFWSFGNWFWRGKK
jgi:hypothetical protein